MWFYKKKTVYTSDAEIAADSVDVIVNINCTSRTGAVLVSQHVVTREGPAYNTYVTVAGTAIACC